MILVTFIKKPNNGCSTPASTSTSHPSCDYSRAPSRPSRCTAPAASLKCYLLKTYTHDQHSFRDNWSPPSPNLKGLNGHYTRGNGGAGGAGGPAWHCVLLLCAVVCALFDTAACVRFLSRDDEREFIYLIPKPRSHEIITSLLQQPCVCKSIQTCRKCIQGIQTHTLPFSLTFSTQTNTQKKIPETSHLPVT